MKIAQRLSLLAALPLLLLLIVAAVGVSSYGALAEARETSRIAEALETRVFALGILTYDYLRHREERARVQWLRNHGSLGRELARARTEGGMGEAIMRRLHSDHGALEADFRRLVTHQSAQGAPSDPLWQEQEAWLVARLLLHTQAAFTDAVKLRNAAEQRIREELNFFFAAIVALVALAGSVTAVVAWRASQGIRRSLRRLHQAAEAIAGGDLGYRAETGTRDEHGELAGALNTMAEKLRATQQQVVQTEKLSALGTLAAGVAHELNNPLMGVMGYVARARAGAREPEVHRALERAERELQRMGELLKNMLGFARPIEDRPSAVQLHRVIDRSLALMEADFKARGISVITEVSPGLPPVVGGEGHVQQVLVNLLTNARDALEGREERRIRVTASREGNEVGIDVADTGSGIPEAYIGRIFDPFFTTKAPGYGTGLGLAVSRNIMTDLGGTLTCRSRAGEGTVFSARFPAAAPQEGVRNGE